MKNFFIHVSLVSMFVISAGCTAKQQQEFSHWKSDVIGLDRKITLYTATGEPIKTWEGRYKIEMEAGVVRFIHNGKAIMINGTYTIEEK